MLPPQSPKEDDIPVKGEEHLMLPVVSAVADGAGIITSEFGLEKEEKMTDDEEYKEE